MGRIIEGITWKAKLWAEICRADGTKEHIEGGGNLLLNDGCELLSDIFNQTVGAFTPQCIAIGSGTTAPTVNDTDLETLFAPESESYATVNKQVVGVGRTILINSSFGTVSAPPWAVSECVLADTNAARGARKCFARSTSLSFTLGAGDTVTIFWQIEFVPNL